MFEPQDYPDDFAFPGAAPTPPYDTTGWTLACQMGVQFDRVLEGFDGPFEQIEELADRPDGEIRELPRARGFFLSHEVNDAFIAVNRLLKDGESVHWLRAPVDANGKTYPVGAMYIEVGPGTVERLGALAEDLGLVFDATATEPAVEAFELGEVRVGLWDRYGGSTPSGWTRFLLENFEFPFEVVYPQQLDRGNLTSQFDVLIFVDDGIPPEEDGSDSPSVRAAGIPEQYSNQLGEVTLADTVPRLREFLESGGTILTIGGSTALAEHLGLPVSDALVERVPNEDEQSLTSDKFFIPGSLLRVQVNNDNPLAFGLGPEADVVFSSSPAFRLDPEAAEQQIVPVAWFGEDSLRSGWRGVRVTLKTLSPSSMPPWAKESCSCLVRKSRFGLNPMEHSSSFSTASTTVPPKKSHWVVLTIRQEKSKRRGAEIAELNSHSGSASSASSASLR